MTDELPPGVGWLQYRLAVAFCSAVAMFVMLLVVPFILALASFVEALVVYKLVFSKWGASILIGTAALGFIIGGERTASFFAVIWGTHPLWSELEGWLREHDKIAVWLGFVLVALVVWFFWFSFR